MASLNIVFIGCTIAFVGPDTDANAALKQRGAEFRPRPLYRFLVNEETRCAGRPGAFITVGEKWTGDCETLRLLNQIHPLREISFTHPKFEDAWCTQFTNTQDLRGLFFAGEGFTDKGLAQFRNLNNITALGIIFSSVTDKGLKAIKEYRQLRSLNLTCSLITNDGLKDLCNLTKLERLHLDGTDTSGTGIKHLASLKNLRWLSLSDKIAVTNQGNSGIAYLSCHPELEKVSSARCVTNDELKGLSNLKKLKELDLRYNDEITDKGVSYLASLDSLEELNLESTSISSRSGDTLCGLKKLVYLNVANTKVSDGIVPYLSRVPTLKTVIAHGTEMSESGKESLRKKGIHVH